MESAVNLSANILVVELVWDLRLFSKMCTMRLSTCS
jgi:hypothetical protein